MTTESFRKETKIGLSYGQILSTLTLLILIGASYVNLKTDIATLTEKAQNNKERIEETSTDMKGFILENKTEHKGIMERLDKIIMYNSRRK